MPAHQVRELKELLHISLQLLPPPTRLGRLSFISAGPIQLIFFSAGPVQLIFVSAGPAQLIFTGPAQLVFVSVGSVQFRTTRTPPGAPGLVSGLWGDGLEPSPRVCSSPAPSGACSSPAPSGADSSQVLSSSSAGPAQLIIVSTGSVQISRTPARVRAAQGAHESQSLQSAPKSWTRPAHLGLRWSRPVHLGLRWSRPAHLGLSWSRPAHLGLRWSRPAHLHASRAPPRDDELPHEKKKNWVGGYPPWPPESPDPSWLPESPDPPWPTGSWNGHCPGGHLPCLQVPWGLHSAHPPPFSMLYGAGRAYWERGG